MYSTPQRRNKSRYHNSQYCVSLGKKWYRLLLPKHNKYTVCLLTAHPEPLEQKIVIGFETPPIKGDKKHSRPYALFNSYIELFQYQSNFPLDGRHFYEIIMGDSSQKPHFDIDIKRSQCPKGKDLDELGRDVKDDLIAGILTVGEENGVAFSLTKDILVYTSHGESKLSYHIIIHHYCHSNHKQAKAFYKAVTSKMNDENAIYVDHSVYSSRQNFRILGSQKISSYRPKRFCEVYTFRGKEIIHDYDIPFRSEKHKELESFKISLISWISECEYLPSFQDDYEREQYVKQHIEKDYGDISQGELKEAIQIIDSRRAALGSKFPFVVREVKGNIISLRRLRPSWCSICARKHEHENPYAMVVDNNLYFYCRRSDSGNETLVILTTSIPHQKTPLLELSEDSEDSEEGGMKLCLGNYKPPLVDQSLSAKKEEGEGVKTIKRKSLLNIIKYVPEKEEKEEKDVLELLQDLGYNPDDKSKPDKELSEEKYRVLRDNQYLVDMEPINPTSHRQSVL